MAKIMLVEDDTNLSEIYQARLTAEGYQIVSAHDGEEALALAAKEKPELIVSDVMMPKISGFEMLDILRNTEGLKDTKVIMLTALGQAEDKTRAEGLGADRYLVKSQVTLEDIVKAAQELLEGPAPTPAPVAPAVAVVSATPVVAAPVAPMPVATPVAMPPAPMPVQTPAPAPVAVAPVAAPAPAPSIPVAAPLTDPTPVAPMPVATPTPAPVAPAPQPVAAPPVPVPAPMMTSPVQTPEPAPAPVATPTPAPVVPSPAPMPAPVTTANPTAAADNKLMNDAVEDLLEGVPGKVAAAATPPAAPEPAVPAPAPTAEPTPDTTETDDNASNNDNVGIAHKKVIRPITDGSASEKPSLETLLANEERKNPGSTGAPAASSEPPVNTPVTNVPHQPGHIITPSAADSLNSGSGIDPNSIAL
jgi:CheY-like chemotaxis protein